MIGGITLKGPPNQDGEVEIGYGIAKAVHNNGSMTECMHGVVQWTFQQDGVAAMTAETAKENLASEVVFRKNRCMHVRDTEEFRYWKIHQPVSANVETVRPYNFVWQHEGRNKCLQ